MLSRTIRILVLFVICVCPLRAQTVANPSTSLEQNTARYYDSIRKSPPQQWAFMLQMPKGADLHSHLSGAIYAESYIQWAADNGLCINTKTMALTAPPSSQQCDPKSEQPPASSALTSGGLYRQMIDAWSMRNWQLSGQSGHDHFLTRSGNSDRPHGARRAGCWLKQLRVRPAAMCCTSN